MANVQHSALTGSDLHEPKGADAATQFQIYQANGSGGGTWVLNGSGWGYYKDSKVHPTTSQNITTSYSKLENDGAASTTEESYLPAAIRGSGSLWDVVNDKITPIAVGDSYAVRLDFNVAATSGAVTEIEVQIDIGGGASPTVPIIKTYVTAGRTAPYFVSFSLPVFTLATFISNGGQIFLKTDAGNIDIDQAQILIQRTHAGDSW